MRFLTIVLVLLSIACSVLAQGALTAQLEGTVRATEGVALDGVTVTVKSPALMGERQAITGERGEYLLRGLPPGEYTISFQKEGLQPQRTTLSLPLGTVSRVDATMGLKAVRETVSVEASSRTALENTAVGANLQTFTAFQLPITATPLAVASLAGGLTERTGNAALISISGGLPSDNLIAINGIGMQDNLFGGVRNLYIEDAVQEIQVLTSGIPAEYGHFSGGVINVLTRSGGNEISGLLRDTMNKPDWLALTPYEKGYRGEGVAPAVQTEHSGDITNIYELTLGGPLLRDRLWYFGAFRQEESTTQNSLRATGYQVPVKLANPRPEYKLTGTLASNQTLRINYINNPQKRDNDLQAAPIDTSAVSKNTLRKNHGYAAAYDGLLSHNLFIELRYAAQAYGYLNVGGTSANIVDSPIKAAPNFPGNVAGTYNAPVFDVTDSESRNDKQASAAASYFLSPRRWGSHDIKGGWERVIHTRTGGNSQSATDYTFYTGYKVSGGKPVLDTNGHLVPVFTPFGANKNYWTQIGHWVATRNAQLDTTSNSFFVNDRWTLDTHWSFNLGVRHEVAKADATAGLVAFDTSNTVPRLAASYDPQGNGKYKLNVTYAQYSGRVNTLDTGRNSPVGNPSAIYGYYTGPAGEGRDFAAGFDPKNYFFYEAFVPTANVLVADDLHEPVNHEWTFSGGMQLPKGGWAKATFTDRQYSDLIQPFITLDLGCSEVSLLGVDMGCFDNLMYRNSNTPKRHYQALELQGRYDLTRNWNVQGNWTHQLKNDVSNSAYGAYPEIQSPRENPSGRLATFQEDRIRLWSTYRLDLRRFGNATAGIVYRYDSPQPFSYRATVPRSAISKSKNPGYHNVGNAVSLAWGDMGIGQFTATSLVDLSLVYNFPAVAHLAPWVKLAISNVFNDDTMTSWITTVVPDSTSALDEWGYPTAYKKASNFGRPAGAASYVQPRLIWVSLGVRF